MAISHSPLAVIVAPGYPRFVHDRDRLTGAGVASGLDTALKLIELLAWRERAERVQQFTQCYPEPPVSSVIPPTHTQCPLPQLVPDQSGDYRAAPSGVATSSCGGLGNPGATCHPGA